MNFAVLEVFKHFSTFRHWRVLVLLPLLGVMPVSHAETEISQYYLTQTPPDHLLANYGTYAGKRGLFAVKNGARSDVWFTYLKSTPFSWSYEGEDDERRADAWMVLRWENGTFRQVHLQPPYPLAHYRRYWNDYPAIIRMQHRSVGGGAGEVWVGLDSGEMIIYDAATYQEKSRLDLSFADYLSDFSLADLDKDGTSELICLAQRKVFVCTLNGTVLWQIKAEPDTYDSNPIIQIGNVDQDAALEIVLSYGLVIDCGSRAVQWRYAETFGAETKLIDCDADTALEIVGETFTNDASESTLSIYDAVEKVVSKVLPAPGVSGFSSFNVDADSDTELLFATGTGLSAYDLQEDRELWKVLTSSEDGGEILVADFDNSGAPELFWLSEDYFFESGYLQFKAEFGAGSPSWQSPLLIGNFLPPQYGDVDGDGKPEIVTATEGNAPWVAGTILVLDADTLRIKASSTFVADSEVSIRSLKLRDVQGDGRLEILTSGDDYTDGRFDIYSCENGALKNIWTKTIGPGKSDGGITIYDAAPGRSIDVVYSSGNPAPAIVCLYGAQLHVFDFASKQRLWAFGESRGWITIIGDFLDSAPMIVGNFDADAGAEVVLANWQNDSLEVIDVDTKSLQQRINAGDFQGVYSAGNAFLANGYSGVRRFQYSGDQFTGEQILENSVDYILSITRNEFFVALNNRVEHWNLSSGFCDWQTEEYHGFCGFNLVKDSNGTRLLTAGSSYLGLFSFVKPPDPARLALALEDTEVREGSSTRVIVQRSGNLDQETTAALEVIRGAATLERTTVRFAAGEAEKFVKLSITEDTRAETGEDCRVKLSSSSLAIVTDALVTARIKDNEPVLSIFAQRASAPEGGKFPVSFRVEAAEPGSTPLEVDLNFSGTADPRYDYVRSSLPVVIEAGKTEVISSLWINDDGNKETTETIKVKIERNRAYHVSADSVCILEIVDNEPVAEVFAVDNSTTEGKDTAQFLIRMSRPSPEPVNVDFRYFGTAWPGSDFVQFPTSATIPAGETEAIIVVTSKSDAKVEPKESITLELIARPSYHLGESRRAQVNILDSTPILTIQPVDNETQEGKGDLARFKVVASQKSAVPLAISFQFGGRATPAEDFWKPFAILPAGELETTVLIQAIEDGLTEGEEEVEISLGKGSGYRPGKASVRIKILDN